MTRSRRRQVVPRSVPIFEPIPYRPKKKRGQAIAEGEVVYAVRSMALIKIGTTTNLDRRLAALQRMNPTPLMLLGHGPGGRPLEAALHRQFRAFRSHGEWFNLPSDQVEVLLGRLRGDPWIMRLGPARRSHRSFARRRQAS